MSENRQVTGRKDLKTIGTDQITRRSLKSYV